MEAWPYRYLVFGLFFGVVQEASIVQSSSTMVRDSDVLNEGQVTRQRYGGEERAMFGRFQSGCGC